MFADDTQIDTSSNNIDSIANILNEDLINVFDWMKANKSSLNTSKTEYMVIGSRKRLHQTQSDPPITLGDNQIKRFKVAKSLGLMIDETLESFSSDYECEYEYEIRQAKSMLYAYAIPY
jgi:hypothetical protein